MTLLMISIPLMVLAVAVAVVPLIVVSCADHRRRQVDATHGSDPAAAVPAAAPADDQAVAMAA